MSENHSSEERRVHLSKKHWILWDGECGFCCRSVSWVQRQDVLPLFEVVPYPRAPCPPMTPALYDACKKAVHVVRNDGTVLGAGRACLFVLAALGWRRTARFLALRPLMWFVELGYRIVASKRAFFSEYLFSGEKCKTDHGIKTPDTHGGTPNQSS